VLHQRNPENSPQYWAQEPARAAPALAIASTATVNRSFFIGVVLLLVRHHERACRFTFV
jgi:hypothetical protein